MEIKEAVLAGLKELILPELNSIKEDNHEIRTTLLLTNKRLNDLNMHLVDQSRRIDEVNKRIDRFDDEINRHIDEVNDAINKRIDELKIELKEEIFQNTRRIDEINKRLDRLYEIIVRRDEHDKLERRVIYLEQQLNEIKLKLAA